MSQKRSWLHGWKRMQGGNFAGSASDARVGLPAMQARLRPVLMRTAAPSLALGIVVAASFITVETLAVVLLKQLDPQEAFETLYLLGVLVVSTLWGPGLATATSVASAVALAYFRNWPTPHFAPFDAENGVVLVVFLVVALSTNFVAGLARARRAGAAQRSVDLDWVNQVHQLRSLKIGAVLRVGVVVLMIAAMLVGTARDERAKQSVLLGFYAVAAIWALILAWSRAGRSVMGPQQRLVFAIADVATLFGFQLLSTGGYIPLLVMGLVPLIVVPQLSWRRAGVVLAISAVAFVVAVLQDPVIEPQLGWAETVFLFAIYGFLCGTGLVVAYVEQRHAEAIAGLSASREELLADIMTASETERRRISESIHDGPLQDVLAARQDILEFVTTSPGEQLDRAVDGLGNASRRLREVTFELHPAVLERVGLGAAVEQLASFTANRSGIAIATDIDYPTRTSIDPIVFGVVRELLSNVARHSQASQASVKLALLDHTCHLDVADNGIGTRAEAAARRLAHGHIGLASHRARVEAAGGTLTFVDEPVGTHVRVQLPLPR
jgi:two-component system, NarL family, sensor kinase